MVVLASLLGCRKEEPLKPDPVRLPAKTLQRRADGAIEFSGHWVLKSWEESPGWAIHGAQKTNAATLRCWPSKLVCEEYRAEVKDGVLATMEPFRYKVSQWDGDRTVAARDEGVDIHYELNIDATSGLVALHCRRSMTLGRAKIEERWELE